MHPTLAVEFTTAVLVIVAVLSVVLLVLIIVAPWRQVRDEPPLDKAVEAKLLLHRNPDEPTGEVPGHHVLTTTATTTRAGDLSDLADLNDPPEPPRPETGLSRQVTAKNIRASQVVSSSTVRARLCPAAARAQPLDVDQRRSSSPGRTSRRQRTFSTPPNSGSLPA